MIDTGSGAVLLLGCAHAGVTKVLEHVCGKRALESVYAVIGGTHLGMSIESATSAATEAFEQIHVQVLAPAHCTGPGPKAALKSHFGARFRATTAGDVFEF